VAGSCRLGRPVAERGDSPVIDVVIDTLVVGTNLFEAVGSLVLSHDLRELLEARVVLNQRPNTFDE